MNIKRSVMNDTLNKLTARKNAPTVVFVILILLVILASVVNSSTAGVKNEVNIFGVQIPINSLTGVFSALSEICVIFMPVFCGKKGYFTALFLQIIQLPMIIIGIKREIIDIKIIIIMMIINLIIGLKLFFPVYF